MWETYSVLSKNRQSRITREDFMNYFHLDVKDIRTYNVQEFLDFFEVSREDLHMVSAEEILIMLRGFSMDREAEKEDIRGPFYPGGGEIMAVEFRCLSDGGETYGTIDFVNRLLTYCSKECTFSDSDGSVLLQSLYDLGLMRALYGNDESSADELWEFLMIRTSGIKGPVRVQIACDEMLKQIIAALLT